MNKIIKIILQIAVILVIGIGAMWLASLFSTKNDNKEIAKEVVKGIVIKKPQCVSRLEDYENLKNTGKTITLVKGLNSYGIENDGFVNEKIISVRKIGNESEIACGYLYVLADKGGVPLDLSYENLYIKPSQFGGHINNTTAIISNKKGSATEMLFNLSNIVYKQKRDNSQLIKADWASLLNVADQIDFNVALNTLNPQGKILEMSITYKCWNPETGDITNDCGLEIIN